MNTKIIDNFSGRLTRDNSGDMNSGFAKYAVTFGNDPFTNPNNLTWFEKPTDIDHSGDVITDLIMAARTRLESGITYVYAIGHTGRLYKIQVNQPSTYNPNYDTPVLLTILTVNSPTFKYGSSIQFYGNTEKIYIGHDLGVTSVNFDGSGEAFVGVLGSYTANVPRPSINFQGVTYWGNGTNLLAIDATATVTTYAKLIPGFPVGTFVRDLDISPDGNYAQIIVSRIPPSDMTSLVQDTNSLSSADSYKFLWNGSDPGYTSYESYNSYSIGSNITYGPFSYTVGYDTGGAAIYTGGTKIVSLPNSLSPNFEAMFSTGNLVGFTSPEYDTLNQKLASTCLVYGQYDEQFQKGLYRYFRVSTTDNSNDFESIQMPVCLVVSNLLYGAASSGYAGNIVGAAKIYYSDLQNINGLPTYRLHKFNTFPTGLGDAIAGRYETQTELFSKKQLLQELRIYSEAWTINSGLTFDVDLIDSSGNSLDSITFNSTNLPPNDYAWWKPTAAPTYGVGIRISNHGTTNFVINKIELDYTEGGK